MTTVTTQTELDAAIAAGADDIIIDSPMGVWLTLRGSSHVVARGSSHVEARGSSHVVAWDSSHVVAWGSSHVEARDSSHVVAGAYVAVHLWSQRVTLDGGVVIDMTTLDLGDRDQWIAYRGVKVTDGKVLLYKAVDADLRAGQRHTLTAYPIGEIVTAPDWRDDRNCGGGLHFGLTPRGAARYFNGDGEPRYLAVEVDVATLIPLDDKAKAPSCRVLREVDAWGDPIKAQSVTA